MAVSEPNEGNEAVKNTTLAESRLLLLAVGASALVAALALSCEPNQRLAELGGGSGQVDYPDGDKSARAQQHVESATDYRDAGQLGLALIELEQALAVDPAFAPAGLMIDEVRAQATVEARTAEAQQHVDAARNFQQRGFFPLALLELERALGIDSGYEPAQHLLESVGPEATARAATQEAEVAILAATAQAARETQRQRPRLIDPRELAGEPNRFLDQEIILQGAAVNVVQNFDDTWVRFMAVVPGGTAEVMVVVVFRPNAIGLRQDQCLRITGVARGTQEVGPRNPVPRISGLRWESAPRNLLGLCAAPI